MTRMKRMRRTTWLGTYSERRGKWHGVPYVVRTNSTEGTTLRGWIVIVLAILLLIAIVLVEELVL
jgi:hypothetical protein